MEQEQQNTKPKKRLISYIVLAACVLLLVTAIVLTVYFVTRAPADTLVVPPDDSDNLPTGPSQPSIPDTPTGPSETEDPIEPSTGDDAVRFVSPIENVAYTVEYNVIYNNRTLGWTYRHKAVDFDAAAGTEVCSMADGTVESISYSRETGNYITIDHGDGLRTKYRFVEPDSSLKEGAAVKKGERIGVVAEAYGSERADGEHLHLEVLLGKDNVDPTAYLDPVLSEK